MMLKHIGKDDVASNIEQAILKTLNNKEALTKDLGGNSTNKELTTAIINNLK